MPYGVKYQGSLQSLDGSVYTVKILRDGYSSSIIPIHLAGEGSVVRWSKRERELYDPVMASTAEILLYDKAKTVLNEIQNQDENLFRLLIERDGSPYWTGKLLTDGYDFSLDTQPEASRFIAVDGLGTLDAIAFNLTGRVSFVQTFVDVLGYLGLGLNIHIACNWFTPEIDESDDPLAVIKFDRDAFLDDQGEQISALEALKRMCFRFGLELYQSGGAWRIIQREVLADSSYRYFIYNSSGVYQSVVHEFNPAVSISDSGQYDVRRGGGRGTNRPAFQKIVLQYVPKPDVGSLMPNPSFEEWEYNLPVGWTKSDEFVPVTRQTYLVKDGAYAVQLGACYSKEPEPPFLFYGCLTAISGMISGKHRIRIMIPAALVRNPLRYTELTDATPRRAYFSIFFGGHYLKRDQNGELSWIEGEPAGFDEYILFRNIGVSVYGTWAEDEFITPELPTVEGQLMMKLYQVVEHEFIPGQESTTAAFTGIAYDAIETELLPVGEAGEVLALETTAESLGFTTSVVPDPFEVVIGDGPSSLTISRLTVGDTTLTANWKRGPYESEPGSEISIDAMSAVSLLKWYRRPVTIHRASYIRRSGAGLLLDPHHVLLIGTDRYGVVEFEKELLSGNMGGEWWRVLDVDSDIIWSIAAVVKDPDAKIRRTNQTYSNSTRLGSETFADGINGGGWAIYRDPVTGRVRIVADEFFARVAFTAGNMVFQNVQAHNGDLLISDTGPAIVKDFSVVSDDTYDIEWMHAGPGLIPDDIVWTRSASYDKDANQIKQYEMYGHVVSVTEEGRAVVELESGGHYLEHFRKGIQFARMGSLTQATRQGYVWISSNPSRIDIADGIDSISKIGSLETLMVRLGKLGVTHPNFGNLTSKVGGLFQGNVYVVGTIAGGAASALNTGSGYWMSPTGDVRFGDVASNSFIRFVKDTGVVTFGSAVKLQWAQVEGTGRPDDYATYGADWSSNLANIPAKLYDSPSGAGLYISATHLGYYSGSAWTAYIDNTGLFYSQNTAAGNTTVLSSTGTYALIAGPTGAPTFTLTHAGLMTAVGGTFKTSAIGARVEIGTLDVSYLALYGSADTYPAYIAKTGTSLHIAVLAEGLTSLAWFRSTDYGGYLDVRRILLASKSDVGALSPIMVGDNDNLCTNLNADLLDGNHASAFATSAHNHDSVYVSLIGSYSNPSWITSLAGGKISGTVADAMDSYYLQGYSPSAFAASNHNHTGVYHPYVAGGATGTIQGATDIFVSNGIITGWI